MTRAAICSAEKRLLVWQPTLLEQAHLQDPLIPSNYKPYLEHNYSHQVANVLAERKAEHC